MITKSKHCLISLFMGLCYVHAAYSKGYVITTPRRWTSGSDSQVCVSFRDLQPGDVSTQTLLVSIKSEGTEPKDLMVPLKIFFTKALGVQCEKVFLPPTTSKKGQISITGLIEGTTIDYTKPIAISTDVIKTFTQTDKYLYKPSQTVKFRILTVLGPKLRVSTDQYKEIFVENPSGTRIAQWLNVANDQGLIHKEFQLSEEPQEGSYKIKVLSPDNKYISTIFKVEDYVLPRYKVNIKPPKFVLGDTEHMTFKVCAKYTFGQPVKGTVTLTVHNGGWGSNKISITKQGDISGCTKLNLTAEELKMNGPNFFAFELEASAIVIEKGTDVELKAKNAKVSISRTALSFKDISTQRFYKPESVYLGQVEVTLPDDSPASNEPMKICIGYDKKICKNVNTNNKGILKFAVPPHLHDENINVEAVNYPRKRVPDTSWRSIMYQSSFNKKLKKYHSPTNSSLVIELQDDKLDCIPGQKIKFSFPVSFAAVGIKKARVSVQAISRGQIMFASNDQTEFRPGSSLHINPDIFVASVREPITKNLDRGSFTKTVELSAFASPKIKLIVFYSRPDGEVVSDVRTVDITECLMNSVNLTWSATKAQPGEETNLTISAEPQSLCSIGVVDKSVQLLASKNTELTISKLLEVADRASVKENENRLTNDYEYCRDKMNEEKNKDKFPLLPFPFARFKRSFHRFNPFYSDDIDALHMFDDAGVYVFSDMQLESRPCRRRYDSYLRPWWFLQFLSRPSYLMGSTAGLSASRPPAGISPSNSRNRGFTTQKKPKNKPIAKKENNPRIYLPETWLWKFVPMLNNGVVEELLTLPDTITEWVGSAVCVHPTKGVGISQASSITTFRDFFADLTLPASVKRGETFPVKVSVFNYLKEPLPVIVILQESPEYDILADEGVELGSGERSSCIPQQDKSVQSIRIKPKAVGNINITVTAFVDINSLGTCGNGTGKFRTDTLIKPVKVEIEGFEKTKTVTQYVCKDAEIQNWNIAPPQNIIPDSARGFISAVGSLMGPTFENIGNLVKMPYGCGEQNMLNFAPNIFVMPYFTEETKELAEKAIGFMEKGYQRELNYRHRDGSYSAFGERDDSGSTWLTAFVLKSFAQAREYIAIDSKDLSISQDWLKSKQLENGCFESVGKVLHKGMKGGLSKTSSPSLLSSFVMIALLEAGEDPAGKVMKEALLCLNADTIFDDSYALAVKAYALSLANDSNADSIIVQLMNNAAKNSLSTTHWDLPEDLGSSVEVETAGYAVLALLTRDSMVHFGKATSIIQWMNQKRNGQGGFVSTQDTIVALQAIAKFDEFTSKGPVDLDLIVEMISANSVDLPLDAVFNINNDNDLLQQKVQLPFVPLDVNFVLAGEGCVLIQGVLRYNEPEPESSEAFGLTVTAGPEPGKNCKTRRVKACVSYLLPDFESNMGIIEVSLVSGYIPVKDDLKKIIGYGTGFFKRYEVDGNVVTFYVDKFTTKELCISFAMKQEVEVEDPKPGTVKVYDYYKPEYYVSETYKLPIGCDTLNEPELPFLSEIIPDITIDYETTIEPPTFEEIIE